MKAEKSAKKDGDIFDAKKEGYKPSEQRKTDQTAIDTQVDDYIEWLNYTCMMSTYNETSLVIMSCFNSFRQCCSVIVTLILVLKKLFLYF